MKIPPYFLSTLCATALLAIAAPAFSAVPVRSAEGKAAPRSGDQVAFKKIVIDPEFRSEGVAVADINRNGKLDIMAGNFWYEAPNWTPHEIAPAQKFDPQNAYSNSFVVYADDVNGDGWPDEVVFGFPGQAAFWRENPKGQPGPWKEHPICPHAQTENPAFIDLLGNGKPVLVFASNDRTMAWWEPDKDLDKPFIEHVISDPATQPPFSAHGLGVGDINGDGRLDIITPHGYWLQPADAARTPWQWIPAQLGPDAGPMAIVDVNLDGLPDVISSSPHQAGVWWFEQGKEAGKITFTQHLIDDSFSQSHALAVADINGDGQPDIVTGKRKWAHGTHGDVRPDDPPVLYWYEMQRNGRGQVTWVRHQIDDNSGVGLQVLVVDINHDGKPDIVVSNKLGVFLFLQE
jgi:hypothetical protein